MSNDDDHQTLAESLVKKIETELEDERDDQLNWDDLPYTSLMRDIARNLDQESASELRDRLKQLAGIDSTDGQQ